MKRTLAIGTLLCAAGCWATPVAYQTRSVEDDQPRTDAPRTPENRNSMTRAEVSLPPPPGQPGDFRLFPTVQRSLSGGIVALARDWDDEATMISDTALVRLTLPIGSDSGEIGLAEFTARAVTEVANAAKGKPSLRHQIESLGGDLSLRIGSRSISFDLTVPRAQWRTALEGLITAVVETGNGEQIEMVRRRLVTERRREFAEPGIENLLDLVMYRGGITPDDYLAGMEDRTPEEVELFQRLGFQPAGSVLAVYVPKLSASDILDAAAESIAVWTGVDAPSVDAPAPPNASVDGGIYWATSEQEICHFALVLPLPHLASPRALEFLTLVECLTMGGVSGRLGEAMRELHTREIVLRPQPHWDGATRHLVLWARGPREQVTAVWTAWERARRSFFLVPPTPEEAAAAAQRLRLRLMSEYADPRSWLEAATSQGLRGEEPADVVGLLERLEDTVFLDLEGASRELIAQPSALVVLGSQPPAEAGAIEILANAFAAAREDEVPAEIEKQIEAAVPYLDSAVAAVGDRTVLGQVTGFAARMQHTTIEGAKLLETVWYRTDGHLRIVRQILNTTIETLITPKLATESSGPTSVTLEQTEIDALFERARRHPLLLLGAYARDEISFRLVSLRTSEDREMAVLELLDPGRRLRLVMDVESGLVRSVETREWRPDLGTHVQLSEHYTDYRAAGALRTPYHYDTMVDGSDHLSTTFGRMVLETPGVKLFVPGAPTKLPGDA